MIFLLSDLVLSKKGLELFLRVSKVSFAFVRMWNISIIWVSFVFAQSFKIENSSVQFFIKLVAKKFSESKEKSIFVEFTWESCNVRFCIEDWRSVEVIFPVSFHLLRSRSRSSIPWIVEIFIFSAQRPSTVSVLFLSKSALSGSSKILLLMTLRKDRAFFVEFVKFSSM